MTKDLSFLANGWRPHLENEFTEPYMENLRNYLKEELRQGHPFFPDKNKIFRALKCVDYDDVKVVILGQDPYHGRGQANGLAFAVENGMPPPPSLINIFKEINADLQQGLPKKTNLEGLAEQGVLLLNTVLTVRESAAFSHRNKGWEFFTDKVITVLNSRQRPIVFLLWGAAAQSKETMITNRKHKIFKAPHPSPLSANRGFLGCKHFSKANQVLKTHSLPEILWTQT